jgi:hypothetical protein
MSGPRALVVVDERSMARRKPSALPTVLDLRISAKVRLVSIVAA